MLIVSKLMKRREIYKDVILYAYGKDWQATRMNEKIHTVRLIDSIGQILLEESGLALIPGVDEHEDIR